MQSNPQAESFFGEDFQNHLVTFLSYLTFWQDVLEHCRSTDVRHTLIDHFQILFLQQLLYVIENASCLPRLLTFGRYPSLLESSDADGGSSVAVLTYLRRILDALDHPELVNMILQYLLALTDYTASSPRVPRSPAAVRRRQSLMVMSAPDEDEDRLNPSLFNLVDLILGSTNSRNAQTVGVALKLTTVILSKNHGYALGSLLKVMHIHHKEPLRTVGGLNIELETYLNLAMSIAGEDGVDEAYDSQLKDMQSMLESHPCSLKAMALPESSMKSPGYFDDAETTVREVDPHYLLPEDPLLQSLIALLLRFLTNDVETNLALTETIIAMGTCAQLKLEGWLAVDPTDYQFEDSSSEPIEYTNDSFRDMLLASRLPTWKDKASPLVLVCLQQLQAQIEALRADIPDWDDHVASRKTSFRFHEEMHDAMKMSTPQKPSRQPSDTPTGTWTPQIPKHVLDSSTTPSRTGSPRGRKEALAEQRNTPAASPAPSRFGGQTLVGSPSRALSPLPAPHASNRQVTLFSDIDANFAGLRQSEFFKRRIRFRRPADSQEVEVMLSKYQPPPKDDTDETTSGAEQEGENDDVRDASLLHIITNVVILQEFVLELVALMQVRASLFSEVRFA
jgi:hypothetical protein